MPEPLTLQKLDDTDRDAIVELLLDGRRVSEVIAHGLTRRPGWRRPQVIDLIAAHGWTLDSDGRVPRQYRTRQIPPATPLPGQEPPAPPRRPVAQWGGAAGSPDPEKRLVELGKEHGEPHVRRLAERAEQAMKELAVALADEQERVQLRAQLAQLDAQRAQLLAKLGGRGTRKKPARPKTAASTPNKPIRHGTWGGYLTHRKRGHPEAEIDADCMAAKDTQMVKLHGRPPTQAAPAAGDSEDADHG